MERPRQVDEDDVLDKALRVFWAKGFEASSPVYLQQATELKKSSLCCYAQTSLAIDVLI
jgi:hypothetical protein